MLVSILIAEAIAQAIAPPAPLELNLACKGTYREQETARKFRQYKGVFDFHIHGTDGELRYDDGISRSFKDAVVEPTKIVATYSRLFTQPRIEIDRLTGKIWVRIGGLTYFQGSCDIAPVLTQPKF